MKNGKIMAYVVGGLYVGAVYAVGTYLGYRKGKNMGKFEAYMEQAEEGTEKVMKEVMERYPELFEADEES